MASNAVGSERVSRITGYKVEVADFSSTTPNLPMRIVLLGEANTANQATLDTDKWQFTTLNKVAEKYGFGSPIHLMMRIIKSQNSGVGGIPVDIIAQETPGGATAKVFEVTVSGVATKNGTHTIKIAGRNGLDGASYNFNVNTGDSNAEIVAKIEDVINNSLSCPVSADSTEYEATLTSKWKGLTANYITAEVDTNDNDLGLTYTVTSTASGAGTPDITSDLLKIGTVWNTILVNGYGLVSDVLDALEDFNGLSNIDNPTGRYASIVYKPLVAISGSVSEDDSAITDLRKDEMTIALAVAPLSKGLPFEAAANVATLAARTYQDTPHLDISGKEYPDMPTPTTIGAMEDYEERDRIVKLGSSTVSLNNGKYKIEDFVTTYHKEGEFPPAYRYVRTLIIDWNVFFGYYLKEQLYVVDHVIANDIDTVNAAKVIKPKQWKAILFSYSEDLSNRALIVDPAFMQDSTVVNISTTNPDRLETLFRYKRSGYVRIASTTAQAGFNFGNV